MKRSLGHLLLAIYLILVGISLLGVLIPSPVTAIVALLAGILLLLGK